MIKKSAAIFTLIFCFYFGNGFAKYIVIDQSFSSVEIYNSMLNNTSIKTNIELEIKLKNSFNSTQQLYLSIINPTIDKIIIKDSTNTVILGDSVRFTDREFKHNNHIYPILLAANQEKTITVKVLKYNQAINFRANIATENNFIKTTNNDNFFLGIFFGILFMFILLLICFYIFSKSKFFIIYLLINLFMLLIIFQYTGIGYQFFWFFSATIQKYVAVFSIIMYFILHAYFIQSFFIFQIKNIDSKFLLKVGIIIFILFGIVALFQFYNNSYGNLISNIYYYLVNSFFIIYGLLVISLCIRTYFESHRREIVWVFIGFLFHFLCWIIMFNNEFLMIKVLNVLSSYKLYSTNIFVPQIIFLLLLLEIFVVTIFISINYHKLIKQNNLSSMRLEFLQKRSINKFVLGQEEERQRITKKIGNSISYDINHLKSLLKKLKQDDEKKIVANVLHDIDKTLEDIKNITTNYVAPNMQKMLLAELITTASEKIFTEINLQFDFSKIPDNYQLNAIANINLYRIVQEISNNIIKHSAATNVMITTIKDSNSLQIKIIDDGIGFIDIEQKSKGIGLMNIESRMNSLNGNFYILSNAKKGSTMHLILPLKDISC